MRCDRSGKLYGAGLMVMLAVTLSSGAVAEAAGPVEIKPVQNTPLPAVRIVPAQKGDLSIPACRGVVWQRFDTTTESYVAISAEPCGAMAPASVLPKDGRKFTVDGDVADGDVVRAVVVVGTECSSGHVFSLAQCATMVAVEGPTITVRRAE